MTGPQQQHDDPFGETRAQLVQGLAVLATVSEAVARWYAVGLQRRAEAQTKADRAAQVSQAALEQAEQLAREAELAEDRAERQHVAQAFDDDWLAQADLAETARLWRTANLRAASGDDWAREGMQRAEQRLRQIRPNLMAFYDRFRSEGDTPAQAMQAAAYAAWARADSTTLGPQARAHPGRVPSHRVLAGRVPDGRALGPGGRRLNDLDAAVRREVMALADGVDPQVLDHLQRQWREQGLLPPADAADLLAAYARELQGRGTPAVAADQLTAAARRAADGQAAEASHLSGFAGQEHGTANQSAGRPDVATAVDEHRAGLDQLNTTEAAADLDDLRAAQADRLSRTFPRLTMVQATTPHLAGKREAPIVSTRQRGRAR